MRGAQEHTSSKHCERFMSDKGQVSTTTHCHRCGRGRYLPIILDQLYLSQPGLERKSHYLVDYIIDVSPVTEICTIPSPTSQIAKNLVTERGRDMAIKVWWKPRIISTEP
jgi:hypothetical protein